MFEVASLALDSLDCGRLRAAIEAKGWVLVRAPAADRVGFEALCRGLFDAPMIHGGRRPRTGISDAVQTVDPGEREIAPHCEYAYTPFRPDLAAFHCTEAPTRAGETTLVDGVALLDALAPQARADFEAQDLTHDNEVPAIGWQRMFGIEDPSQLAAKLDAMIELFAARGGREQLRYRIGRDATLWFRYQGPAIVPRARGRAFATSVGFPPTPDRTRPGKHTWLRFADGSVVDDSLRHAVLRDHGERLAVAHRWRPGDVLIADNWSVLHGRRAFVGAREIDACFGYADWLRPPDRAPVRSLLWAWS
ncbi:SyrP-like protein [Enhygromyxa salina]|uniref:SyrP-like protein n=1 Tax=Enhygromyxa salina TaxID=215803 RepID=A0A0C2D1H0_9BACT|nr:SyrP-like protein [Enhygromyxa salina]